jgi:hypothetical protein
VNGIAVWPAVHFRMFRSIISARRLIAAAAGAASTFDEMAANTGDFDSVSL